MIILGLHFGHDASVSIIRDGEILLCYEVERHKKIKHCIGLEYSDIVKALKNCGLVMEDIDYATLTSTQLVEYIFPEPQKSWRSFAAICSMKWQRWSEKRKSSGKSVCGKRC